MLTNKAAKGKKSALMAMIKSTSSETIISIIKQIPEANRLIVKEITLDMAGSMKLIAEKCSPKATLVIDRFHVQKLAYDALQEMRIAHRWYAINEETNSIQNSLDNEKKYPPLRFSNGGTKKQLLARSRYLLFKSREKWTQSQKKGCIIP